MNKKIYLLSFAAAAMFASCSNEMDEFVQAPQQEGFKVGITIKNDAPETRIVLNDNGKDTKWEFGDKFSLFNVGTTVTAGTDLTASANAAYQTRDGENFESANVLYLGKHALVFPLNQNYVDASKNIEIAPITDGSISLGNRSVFLSKTLVDITTDGLKNDKGEKLNKNQSGYNKDIQVKVRPASTALVLNLNQSKALAITSSDPALTINKVELEALGGKTPFTKKATLQEQVITINAKGDKENRVVAVPAELTSKAAVTFNSLPFASSNTKVRIVTLPNTSAVTDNYALKVYTNYGVVTIDKAKMVTGVKDGKTLIQAATRAELSDKNKDAALSFDTEFATLAGQAAKAEAVSNIEREVNVDMSTADINDLTINNSTDLLAAFRAYELLSKKTASFTLNPDKNGVFTLTKAAVNAINKYKYNEEKGEGANIVTAATTIILDGYGTADYNAIPEISQIENKALILAAGNKWAIDVHSAKTANRFTSITNKGEIKFTMSNWDSKNSVKLTKAIENDGIIVFGGNVNMPTAINDTYVTTDKNGNVTGCAGTITVADGQIVKLQDHATMTYSTINIGSTAASTAILASSNGKIFTIGAKTTTNVYGSLLNESGATLTNAGVINIKDAMAGVIISTNSGIINVTTKDNLVNVEDNTNGKIKLPVNGDFTVNAANMGIANYVVYSGSNMIIAENFTDRKLYIEFSESGYLKSNIKNNAAANVHGLIVNSSKMVTIPNGAKINATSTTNFGTIRVYGDFNEGTVTNEGGASQIYKY